MNEMTIRFGKYKGQSYENIVENDMNYAKWIIEKSNECENIKQHIKSLIKEKHPKNDKYLKNAWYNQEGGDIIANYGMDPDLDDRFDENPSGGDDVLPEKLCVIIKDDYDSVYSYVTTIGFDVEYKKGGSITDARMLLTNYILTDENFYGGIKDGYIKVLSPEWVKKVRNMRICYVQNEEQDKKYRDVPSKQILSYWEIPKVHGKNIGTGKWCLYFNRYVEDSNGLTELDRAYLLLKKNYDEITTKYWFKCSTRRPNPNAPTNSNGVIIIYCEEENRDEIINKIHNLLNLKGKIYWKKHSGNYSKDGKLNCYNINFDKICN